MKFFFTVSVVLLLTVLLCCKREALVDEERLSVNLKDKIMSENTIPCFSENDLDCDGITDSLDNCPEIYNPNQEDFDGDGVGDVCDPNPYGTGSPGGSGTSSGYVSATTYYNNYCMVNGVKDYTCGLARGIKEALQETPAIFANTTVYQLVDKYFKIDSISGTTTESTDAAYCASKECYVTVGVSGSNDPFLIRQANVAWLNGKTSHIDDLKASDPTFSNYYDGYKVGVIEGFWFYGSNMAVFQMP